MKDMSVEELEYGMKLVIESDAVDLIGKMAITNTWNELLRRFEELGKCLTDIGVERDNALVAYESMKCCGNCKHSYSHCYGSLMCKKLDQSTGRGGYCPNWTTDGLTREEREK